MTEPRVVTIDDGDMARPEASLRDKLAFLLGCSTEGHYTAEHFLRGAEIRILDEARVRVSLRNVNADGEICDSIADQMLSTEGEWDLVVLRVRRPDTAWAGQTTEQLISLSKNHLQMLGFEAGKPEERWEGDGVMLVGPPGISKDRHWYLCMSGTDNTENIDEPGIDLILIRPAPESDDHICLTGLDHLDRILREEGYLETNGKARNYDELASWLQVHGKTMLPPDAGSPTDGDSQTGQCEHRGP